MKKILAFGTSTSSTSINQQLAIFAASIVENAQVDVVKLSDFYPMEMFDVDYEAEHGFPASAVTLHEKMKEYDGFILSMAEHNGTYTAAFKNALDWTSRMEGNTFHDKPVLIMGTSPGAMGAGFVLAAAESRFPWNGASKVIGPFSLPKFSENFNGDTGITHTEKLGELKEALNNLVSSL